MVRDAQTMIEAAEAGAVRMIGSRAAPSRRWTPWRCDDGARDRAVAADVAMESRKLAAASGRRQTVAVPRFVDRATDTSSGASTSGSPMPSNHEDEAQTRSSERRAPRD